MDENAPIQWTWPEIYRVVGSYYRGQDMPSRQPHARPGMTQTDVQNLLRGTAWVEQQRLYYATAEPDAEWEDWLAERIGVLIKQAHAVPSTKWLNKRLRVAYTMADGHLRAVIRSLIYAINCPRGPENYMPKPE